jgi:E3 ubiquitin-protein ligase BAH
MAIDASLSSSTRAYLKKLASSQHQRLTNDSMPLSEDDADTRDKLSSPTKSEQGQTSDHYDFGKTGDLPEVSQNVDMLDGNEHALRAGVERIEMPLRFDVEFFGLLRGDILRLDDLQLNEQKSLTQDITLLGREVAKVADPTKGMHSDLYRWRDLFGIYLQSNVFFSTNECEEHKHDAATAIKQLEWFQSEATHRGFPRSFKQKESRQVLESFIRINASLLNSLKFHEINQRAMSKILKSTSCPHGITS